MGIHYFVWHVGWYLLFLDPDNFQMGVQQYDGYFRIIFIGGYFYCPISIIGFIVITEVIILDPNFHYGSNHADPH